MAENILDILTKADRRPFTIDGTAYEMRHPNELSMTDFHLLSKKGSELIAFGEEYASDPERVFNKIRKCMDELVDMIAPDLPKDVKETLNPIHVQKMLDAFIGLSRTEPKPDEPPQSKKLSLDSSASTEAARETG